MNDDRELALKLYRPHDALRSKPNPKLCAHAVWGKWHANQCQRGIVVHELGHGWCKQHAPSAEKARQGERSARWKAENDASDRAAKIRAAEREVIDAAVACAKTDELRALRTCALADAVDQLKKLRGY